MPDIKVTTKITSSGEISSQELDTDAIIDSAVQEAFNYYNVERIKIKQQYYNEIMKHLKDIEIYFKQIERVDNLKRADSFANPYSSKFGFSKEKIAYEINVTKKESAIIYEKLNKILSYLRQGQEINYSLYVKQGDRYYRYSVPESQISDFTYLIQSNNPFSETENNLRKFAEVSIERLENALELSEHISNYMKAIDSTGLKVKLPDKYEAFEYHYQNIDINSQNFSHGFNIEGIRKWILGRGHDVAGWWVRGDIGLTSVKSINLNNKYLFLSLASQKSLSKVYTLLKDIFLNPSLDQNQISRLVKAFTPVVSDLKKGQQVDVQKIVNELIESLIK